MKVKYALLAAVGAAALVQGASAQSLLGDEGFYAGIGAGIVFENDDVDFESVNLPDTDLENLGSIRAGAFDTELSLGDDLSIYGVLGAYLPYNFRVDIEAATRQQDVDAIFGGDTFDGDLVFNGFPSDVALGDVTVTTIMSNLYYDFELDLLAPVTPYLGAGFGAANVRLEVDNLGQIPTDAPFSQGGAIVIEDDDWVPAGQGMAGLTYDFTENMMVDLRYRYLHTGEASLGGFIRNEADLVGFETEYKAHEVVAGLRWNFGAAPAPAPAPQITYKTCFDGSQVPVTADCPVPIEQPVEVTELDPLVVYFDFDRSNLTDAARTLIAARAEEAIDADVETVTVQGNTDTSGSSAYNQALSARRANVVADALVANGISQSVINVQALGESNPAKPTGDGVREPLNRRTEVTFDF